MLSIYKASAGSGKTFTLTREYLRMLLRMPLQPREKRLPHTRILAVTFTKKATAEMKDRILRELYILAKTPQDSCYINDFLADTKIRLTIQQLQEKAQFLLIGILQDYTRFSVSTIDGFFQQVIRTFALELGLSATYDLDMDGKEMVQQAVNELFIRIKEAKDEDKDLMSWLIEYIKRKINNNKSWNPSDSINLFSQELLKEQLIRKIDEIQRVFADKNTMRQYQLQLQQICDSSEQQVDSLLKLSLAIFAREEGWNQKLVKLFHRAPSRWLTEGCGAEFEKVINDPTLIAPKRHSKAKQIELQNIYLQDLQPLFEQLEDICTGNISRDYITAQAILSNLHTMGILQDVARQIETTNRNIGRLPISETNTFVHQIIDEQDAPFIYERIGQHYQHYLIDEFQDTSALQWENFSPLITEAESQDRDNLIVGDVKQSIYRFRNSDWRTLTRVPNQFAHTQLPKMEYNFRTAPVVIANNEKLMQTYSQWVADQIDELTKQPELSLNIRTMYSPEEMHQKPAKSYGGYFHMQFFEGDNTQNAQFQAMLEQLQSIENEGIDLNRVTILARDGNDIRDISTFLIEHGYNIQSSEGLAIGANYTIKLIISLLRNEDDQFDSITEAYIKLTMGSLTEEQNACIARAKELPLYEQVQMLIDQLHLYKQPEDTPYLITFQDLIYNYTLNRVADKAAFLEYWDKKAYKTKIASPATSNAIRVMTIHSSKGLEFDIVMLPCFEWDINRLKATDIIWCTPTTAPFNQLPLVAAHPKEELLKSHFANDYIQEKISQYIDNLNLTYVAITRPRYRLYAYGPMFSYTKKNELKISKIGQLISYLYRDELNEQHIYSSLQVGEPLAPLPPQETTDTNTINAQYLSTPINNRLTLRSRAEDDFEKDTPLATIDLGILMHLWLSQINVWQDAEPALKRLINTGKVTEQQAVELRKQLILLQALIQRENHNDWFSNHYQILSEQDIITSSGNIQRPDRVMISGKHAIIIDYKFGKEKPLSHLEQVRDYMSLLNQMGYTTEGYIIYVALNIIQSIQ